MRDEPHDEDEEEEQEEEEGFKECDVVSPEAVYEHDRGRDAANIAEYRKLEALAYFADGDADIIEDLSSSVSERLERARAFHALLDEEGQSGHGEGVLDNVLVPSSTPSSVIVSNENGMVLRSWNGTA